MAGIQQHTIPQSIIRGFSIEDKQQLHRVWVHPIGQASYAAAIERVAQQRYFYSKPSENSKAPLDEVMTQFENGSLNNFVLGLRLLPAGAFADPTAASEVISHLAIRTAHIREAFLDGARLLITAAESFLSASSLASLLTSESGVPSELFDQVLNSLRGDRNMERTGIPFATIRRLVFNALEENVGDILNVPSNELLRDLRSFDLKSIGRDGHAKALGKNLSPPSLVSQMKKLQWQVHEFTDEPLILPDCVVLGSDSSLLDSLCALPLVERANVCFAVMPVSSDRALVGSLEELEPIKASALNSVAAECSYKFFVSNNNSSQVAARKKSIGIRTGNLVRQSSAEAVKELSGKHKSAEALWPDRLESEYEAGVLEVAGTIVAEYRKELDVVRDPDSISIANVHLSVKISDCSLRAIRAREGFESHKDLERVVKEVVSEVRDMAEACARVVARSTIEDVNPIQGELECCLEDLGLRVWFERLARALRAEQKSSAEGDRDASVEIVAVLIERLWFHFGLLAWEVRELGLWVQPVPILPFSRRRSSS